MCEYPFASSGVEFEDVAMLSREIMIQDDCAAGSAMPMPFDQDSKEAEALRGAIAFLHSLIAFCDEMLQPAPHTGEAFSEESLSTH